MIHVWFFLALNATWAMVVIAGVTEASAKRDPRGYVFSPWLLMPPAVCMLIAEGAGAPLGFWIVGVPHAALLLLCGLSMLRSRWTIVQQRPPRAIVVRR